MAGKVKRLSKVARELNVGISTLVDYLKSKDIEIDSKPNTKLDKDQFEILQEAFADDQTIKEEAQKKKAVKSEKKETVSLQTEAREAKNAEEDEQIEAEKMGETPSPSAKESTEKPAEKEESGKEEEPKPSVKTKKEETGGIKTVGSIDLSKINSRTRPESKKKKTPIKEEAPKQEEKVQEEAATKTPLKEEKPSEEKPKIKKREFLETKTEKLRGPKTVGKIELPKEPEKKKKGQENKRKRRRIKKVDPDKRTKDKNTSKRTLKPTKPKPKEDISEKDIEKELKKTLSRIQGNKTRSKGVRNRKNKREKEKERREKEIELQEKESTILKLTEFVTVSELASMMDVQSTEVISACMSLGIFASINQRLDAETIQIVADEFGFDVEFVSADVQDSIPVEEDKPEDLKPRPVIITVMGHVDHGKTSLLDYIRKENIAEGEAGGITQHIGAYSVDFEGNKLTFLDTPGHEAFTAMRARGAQVTDIAIIIIAADDDVMPQTKEAISHAQAAGVPMVFAINKIDKPGANTNKIKEQLSEMNILVEDWGGKYQSQDISAKKGEHIEELLEKVILEAEILELKANPDKRAIGTVLEASLDKGKGYITNMLVEAGTLNVGDYVLAGKNSGRVKAMLNEKGEKIQKVSPSFPVSILGLDGAPSAGDKFYVMENEKEAKNIATKREQLYREQGLRTQKHITLDEIGRRIAVGDFQELNVIIKGDVDGSIEALSDSVLKLSTEEIQINIIHKGVGAITEADVNLASASDALIVGFQVRPTVQAKKLADDEQIDIQLYSVIYKAIDELKAAMEGMLSPDIKEEIVGTAEVRDTFEISKVGTIAGCYVTSGYILRKSKIRVIRDGIVIHEGTLGSLKRFKDDVKEVKNKYECGLNVEGFNKIKEGDIIEAYEEKEVARKL